MHNFYTIETEAELYRLERTRVAASDARAARAQAGNRNRRWTLPKFFALALPHMPVGAPLELRRVPRPVEC